MFTTMSYFSRFSQKKATTQDHAEEIESRIFLWKEVPTGKEHGETKNE